MNYVGCKVFAQGDISGSKAEFYMNYVGCKEIVAVNGA